MSNIQPLPLKEWCLWRKKVEIRYPWLRQNVDYDFLKYEQKRIKEVFKWYKKFINAGINTYLDEVSLHVVPLELSSSWAASRSYYGICNYFGLAPLSTSTQALSIGLFPYPETQPQEYMPIHITKSKRINLFNKRLFWSVPALIIEEWEPLKSDYLYKDVPYEKRIVQKILKENLIYDEQISLSFQSPIMSAPYVIGSIGGVALSSLSGNSKFANDLAKTFQLMVLPEYRDLPPPKSVYRGYKFPYLNGIKFYLAERPHQDNLLSSICAKQYNRLDKELSRRYNFKGEFSIFSAIAPDENNITQIEGELLKNFPNTDITLPVHIDNYMATYVDLKQLKKAIDEDLQLQVFNSRQHSPRISVGANNEFKIINLLKEGYDKALSDDYKQEEYREQLVRPMLYPSEYNVKRIAQSLARADEKNQVNMNYLKKAADLTIDNFAGFVKSHKFQVIKSKMEKKKENARHSIVKTCLTNNQHSSAVEIFEDIKSEKLFKDIYDLQVLLDRLYREGYVIVDPNKGYVWIGGYFR